MLGGSAVDVVDKRTGRLTRRKHQCGQRHSSASSQLKSLRERDLSSHITCAERPLLIKRRTSARDQGDVVVAADAISEGEIGYAEPRRVDNKSAPSAIRSSRLS